MSEPIFIGSFRSGTTLLINLLGLHPELTPWFETKALCEPLRWLRVIKNNNVQDVEAGLIKPVDIPGFNAEAVAKRMLHDFRETFGRITGELPNGKAIGERYPVGPDCILYSLDIAEQEVQRWAASIGPNSDVNVIQRATGDLITRLGHYQTTNNPQTTWVNKTPEIVRFSPELRSCLGPCRIIMMIRDGRDVVRSAEKLGWASATELAAWWKAMIIQSREGGAMDPNRYYELKYESLLTHPALELDRLSKFLGIERCGIELVRKYEKLLGINDLKEAAAQTTIDRSCSSSVYEQVVDVGFNQELGY